MPVVVSVVMAVYNGSQYIEQALESILSQDGVSFEFIVLNDASTDDTPDILQAYAAKDPRLILLHNHQQQGLTRSLNRAIAQARGGYIARQDADDISLGQRLQQQAAYLDAHPEVVLVAGSVRLIDAQGQSIGMQQRAAPSAVVAFGLHFFNYIGGHSGVMFRRGAFECVGGYDTYFRFSQDYDLWSRLLTQGQLVVLPPFWLALRQHEQNLSVAHHAAQDRFSLEVSQRLQATLRKDDTRLSDKQLQHMRLFWLDVFDPALISHDTDVVAEVQATLAGAYAGFRAEHHPTAAGRRAISATLARHFWRWAQSVSLRAWPLDKLRLWRYAAGWHLRAWLGI